MAFGGLTARECRDGRPVLAIKLRGSARMWRIKQCRFKTTEHKAFSSGLRHLDADPKRLFDEVCCLNLTRGRLRAGVI
ncbi:hypothetical protein DEFR109230_16250 [Deinococcus frigens]